MLNGKTSQIFLTREWEYIIDDGLLTINPLAAVRHPPWQGRNPVWFHMDNGSH